MLSRRRRCILFESAIGHGGVISCVSLSSMQIPFDLVNYYNSISGFSHKKLRTQEVSDNRKIKIKIKTEKEREEKRILITKKKLIKLVNSPAAAPKT